MSAATVFPLMTVEEYDALPDPKGDFTYELQFGRLVKVGKPKQIHYALQRLIMDLIARQIDAKRWFVGIELPYILTEGYDARAADVGVLLRSRYQKIPPV